MFLMSDTPTRKPSPVRILRAWLFRERAVRGPGAIELDVVERQVDREALAIGNALTAATGIARRIDRVRGKVRAALTDLKTPGIIDADETRGIARELNGTAVATHHHTAQLESLT